MEPACADILKTARDLLDYGILQESAENFISLRGCGRQAGCAHRHLCIRLVESHWRLPPDQTASRPVAALSSTRSLYPPYINSPSPKA